ncbi:hypothetical protein ACTFIU_003245 [Dictyostelium citrinum]
MDKYYNEFSKLQQGTIDNNKNSIINSSDIIIENIKNGKLTDNWCDNNNSCENNCKKIIRILDIGSSHGRNSIIVLNLIISNVLKHFPNQCFEVFHNDLPENDFTLLFKEIIENENSYLKSSNQIYYYGVGNSCYNQVVPSNSIDLCFSFSTSHWSPYNSNFHYDTDSIAVMYKKRSVEYRKFCIDTLYKFFSLRSKELKSGGTLICSVLHENNSIPPELDSMNQIFIKMKTVWKQMANENLIDIENVNKMVLFWNVYKEDEVKEVLKEIENENGMKLISIEQKVEPITSISTSIHDCERQINFFYHMKNVSENIIKLFIPGDEKQKELLLQIYNAKFSNYIKENPIKDLGNIYSYYLMVFEKKL